MSSPYRVRDNLLWLVRYFRPSLGNPAGVTPLPRHERWARGEAAARLVFFGDLMCAQNDRVPGVDATLREVVRRADLVVGNCEAPVIFEASRPEARYVGHFAMAEEYLLAFLDALGAPPARCALSIANNHIADQGEEGLTETVARLRERGITPLGSAAEGPVHRVRAGPLTVGLVAWTQWLNSAHRLTHGPGVRRDDAIEAQPWPDLAAETDLLVATPHWDWEFCHFPRPTTRALAAALDAAGFDLIVGHHPHVLQPLERLERGALCWYSAGNLNGPELERVGWPVRLGALLEVELAADGALLTHTLHPFVQEVQRDQPRRLVPLPSDSPYAERLEVVAPAHSARRT